MVAPEDSPSAAASSQHLTESSGGGGTFGKLKQTLSSSLLTAQDKGKWGKGRSHTNMVFGWA